jgi:Exocyst complex component Sec5
MVFLVLNHINVDAEHFYVLEDWVIDKLKGNGVTGLINACHVYQRQIIQGLETLVKYKSNLRSTHSSFGTNYDPGRRIVGKVRTGVITECKKEFETSIFATLETCIKLAKGTVESPAQDTQIEQVFLPKRS